MFNLRWAVIAAATAFVVSLLLGVAVGARALVVLLRALCFGAAFFVLSALIWRLIRRFLPELLQSPLSRDESLMPGVETGSRVNISLGDAEIPRNAAVPPEDSSDESVGNIADVARIGPSARETPGEVPGEAPKEVPGESPRESPRENFRELPTEGPAPPAAPLPAPLQGMDQSPPSRYTQKGEGGNPAPPPASAGGPSGLRGLGDLSGGLESLPDLDALAGTFMSSNTAGGEEETPSPGSAGVREYRSKKGKDVGEDFNPKELASAIQTILKRD